MGDVVPLPKPKTTKRICPSCGGVMTRDLKCNRCGHGK